MFRRFCHDHCFETSESKGLMKEVMEIEAPLELLGRGAERLWLKRHMRRRLQRRNRRIHTRRRYTGIAKIAGFGRRM